MTYVRSFYLCLALLFICAGLSVPVSAFAATMSLSPATGVFNIGKTFTASVVINTKGEPVNAADATLSFNPKELSVVSISKGSVFNLWTAEPSFSNSAGTVSFSGGTPAGYTGSNGVVLSITFRTVSAATARVSMTSGSVLAADGRGTNVLTSMGGGTYTISAASAQPDPEVIVEYVPPANTPATPVITSNSHPRDAWSNKGTATLNWELPAGVTAVRTLLDTNPSSIPTKLYDSPMRTITLTDLPDGVSYFHLQFQNADGWGKIAHYRLAVDTTAPSNLVLALAPGSNLANPTQTLLITPTSTPGAPLVSAKVQLNGGEPFTVTEGVGDGQLLLRDLAPGYQTVVVEVTDAAGNVAVINHSFTVESFSAPVFVDAPTVINPGVIPVFKGTTRGKATVTVTVESQGLEPRTYTMSADDGGTFTFIPDGAFAEGVYTITATAADEFGAQSEASNPHKFAVQPNGILSIGSQMVSVMSVVMSLLALALVSWFGISILWTRFLMFKRRLGKEAAEVTGSIVSEFAMITKVLDEEEKRLRASRKSGKLTEGEEDLLTSVRSSIAHALGAVKKEATDVTRLVNKK